MPDPWWIRVEVAEVGALGVHCGPAFYDICMRGCLGMSRGGMGGRRGRSVLDGYWGKEAVA